MAFSRRVITVTLSALWLLVLTILAGYALYTSHIYNLPIPNTLSALTLALPPIAGLVLETSSALANSLHSAPHLRKAVRSSIPPVLLPGTLAIVALLMYETVIATLAGTHIAPRTALKCALEERWRDMFRAKDGETVARIQDAFQCCGLRSSRDMAFPFPGGRHGADACEVRYERTMGCFEAWEGRERVVAGIMMAVTVGVFLWMLVIVATPAIHPTAVRKALAYKDEDENPRVIEYGAYRDDPETAGAADDDADDTTSMRREIDALNRQSNLDSFVERNRTHHTDLVNDANRWAESRN
ncbi:hypothetical protein MBLNU457_g2462t1 [Dothideomycetes sp. NU457]